jgi:ADP-heptose:LPS heptosyltransferase
MERYFLHLLHRPLYQGKEFRKDSIRRVLVPASMGLGDLVRMVPVLRTIKQAWPESSLTVVFTHGDNRALLETCPFVDECMELQNPLLALRQKCFKGQKITVGQWLASASTYAANLWGIVWQLRRRRFDLIVGNSGSLSLDMAVLVLLTGAPYRAGPQFAKGIRSRYGFIFNFSSPFLFTRNTVENNMALLTSFGVSGDDRLEFFLTPEDREYAEVLFANPGLGKNAAFLGVAPGAGYLPWKKWHPRNFAKVADTLVEEYGVNAIVLGTADDGLVAKFMKQPAISLVGKTSVRQAAAIIERCRYVLANDNGLMHISAALGVPSICIFGPTSHILNRPYKAPHLIVRNSIDCEPCYLMEGSKLGNACGGQKCLEDLTPGEAMERIRGWMERCGLSSQL